jgi:4,4'-diaponeurosporenoate glycosyltransferase
MSAPHYVAAAGWLTGWVLLARVPRLPPLPGTPEGAKSAEDPLTVVIPARNEAETLPLLLGDLAEALPSGSRVIVVDDHSDDGTAEIAREHAFVEVVEAPPIEEGWLGKTWACHTGALRASEGLLVFLDADVRLNADSLRRAVAAYREQGGLLTVWPYHRVERPYEHLSALPGLVALMVTGCGSLLPPRRQRAAFGPLMVTSKEEYERSGGHAAVRGDVVDDFALGRRYAAEGLPIQAFGGGREITFRMYSSGIRSLFQGWTKNFARGAGLMPLWRVLGVIFWLTCAIGSLTWAGGLPRPRAFALYALFTTQMFLQLRQIGSFGLLDALLYPLHVAMALFIALRSLWSTHVRRSVSWRGRDVAIPQRGEAEPPLP